MVRELLAVGVSLAVAVVLVAVPAPSQTSVYINLQAKANHKLKDNFHSNTPGNSLAELPQGEQKLAGVKFKIGEGLIQLGSQILNDKPEKVEGISVDRKFAKLHILHGTGYGGGPNKEGSKLFVPDDTLIGKYLVHYEDKTTANIPINVQEVEVIKAQLAEAGMTMNIKLVDSATQLADGNSKNFDLISYQWSGRPDPDGNTYQFFHTASGTSLNWSSFSNPRVDELLEKTREASDLAERKKLYSEMIKVLQDEMPALFIVHPIEPKAFSPKVQGYPVVPDGMMRFKDVWLK